MLVVNLLINDRRGIRLLPWLVDDQYTDNLRNAKILALAEATLVYQDAYIEMEDPVW